MNGSLEAKAGTADGEVADTDVFEQVMTVVARMLGTPTEPTHGQE